MRRHIPLIYDRRKSSREFILKVSLLDAPLPIYRRLSVPSNIRLCHLAPVILRAMGWVGYHQEEFEKGKTTYARKESVEYYESEMSDDLGEQFIDWSTVTLGDVIKDVGDTITYVYDLGDDFRHEVKLMEVNNYNPKSDPDVYLLGGENACPPDDVGGVDGYRRMLDLLQHPDDDYEEAASYAQWLPEGFDENLFSIRDAKLRIDDYLRGVRTVQQMMGDKYN
jgi:hypothetical protein